MQEGGGGGGGVFTSVAPLFVSGTGFDKESGLFVLHPKRKMNEAVRSSLRIRDRDVGDCRHYIKMQSQFQTVTGRVPMAGNVKSEEVRNPTLRKAA